MGIPGSRDRTPGIAAYPFVDLENDRLTGVSLVIPGKQHRVEVVRAEDSIVQCVLRTDLLVGTPGWNHEFVWQSAGRCAQSKSRGQSELQCPPKKTRAVQL